MVMSHFQSIRRRIESVFFRIEAGIEKKANDFQTLC